LYYQCLIKNQNTMGTAKKSIITIVFKEDLVPLGVTSKTALEQTLLEFYKKSTGKETKPDISITEFEIDGDVVDLELYSGRCVNLDFQVDLLGQYLDECDVEEFYFDNWIQAD